MELIKERSIREAMKIRESRKMVEIEAGRNIQHLSSPHSSIKSAGRSSYSLHAELIVCRSIREVMKEGKQKNSKNEENISFLKSLFLI